MAVVTISYSIVLTLIENHHLGDPGDVIQRTGMKNFTTVSHNRAQPYFLVQHRRGEVRARRVYLKVHSITGNVVDTE